MDSNGIVRRIRMTEYKRSQRNHRIGKACERGVRMGGNEGNNCRRGTHNLYLLNERVAPRKYG